MTARARARADILSARPAESGAGGGAPPPPPRFLTERFRVNSEGVWLDRSDDKPPLWICARLEPIAETLDEENNFGILWGWTDRNGSLRTEVFERNQFAGDAGDMARALAARGLTLNAQRDARNAFVEYVNLASSSERARVVARCGWHVVGGVTIYVQPSGVIGRPAHRVILRDDPRAANPFQAAGTLADWRRTIGAACIRNPRLTLAVCAAFAGALLYPAGEDGGGINLYGASRMGKSSCGIVAASVCGGDSMAGGAAGAMQTWRATGNSMEGVAARHSDAGLVLDELGQADARDVGATAYMLSSGIGKHRMDRSAALRAPVRFRCLYLSTGEMTLEQKISEGGMKVRAGQAVRMVDLPADDGAGMGVFRQLHGAASPGEFAQRLREDAARFYGTAFPAFVTDLVGRLNRDAGFRDDLRAQIETAASALLRPFGDHAGQVRTVARRFALLAVAGNLATAAGITGWGRTERGETEAEHAVRICFNSWLRERGTAGNAEDGQAVTALRAFVAAHGAARFEIWREPDPADQTGTDRPPPADRYPTQKRAGFRRWNAASGTWEDLLTPDGMREALHGLAFKDALRVLVERRLIIPGPSETTRNLNVPGHGKQRLYLVPAEAISAQAAILPATDDRE